MGAQFMEGGVIAMFAFESTPDGVTVVSEQHYRLVRPNELTADELDLYRKRLPR